MGNLKFNFRGKKIDKYHQLYYRDQFIRGKKYLLIEAKSYMKKTFFVTPMTFIKYAECPCCLWARDEFKKELFMVAFNSESTRQFIRIPDNYEFNSTQPESVFNLNISQMDK